MEEKKIITGRNPVLEYLNAMDDGNGIELHLSSGAHGKIISEIQNICRKKNIRIITEDKSFFTKHLPSSVHQGVLLYIKAQKTRSHDYDILKKIADRKGSVVLLDRITDPHNTGSIIRSAEALGCDAIIITKDNSAGINETVIKSSAGATAHIEIITITNISQFIDELKKLKFWIIGTSDHGNIPIDKLGNVHPACVIIGSEGRGMRRLTEEKCDYTVSIPLKGRVSSLNASVAAGIVLYELMKKT